MKLFKVFTKIRHSFWAVIVLVQVLMLSLAMLMTNLTVSVIEKNLDDKHRVMMNTVENKIKMASTAARPTVLALKENPQILEAFAKHNRTALQSMLTPLWSELQKLGYSQFQFSIPKSHSVAMFLRMQNPQEFDDEITNRPMLTNTNGLHEPQFGLEQGKSGYGFRYLQPLYWHNEYIGIMELGTNFGEGFLQELSEDYPGGYGLFSLQRGIRTVDDHVLVAKLGQDGDGEFQNLLPEDAVLEKVKRGQPYFTRSETTATASMFIPIKNFQGDIVLILKYTYPSAYYKYLHSIIFRAGCICLIALFCSIFVLLLLHRLISAPLKRLVVESEKIRNFQLQDDVAFESSLSEINELIKATRAMKIGLQSFQKYVPAELVRQLVETEEIAAVGGKRRNITVLFSDISNFTTIAEALTPNELTAQLSEYFNEMTNVIMRHQGTVDKYIGDAVMAFWGAPVDVKDHAMKASLAALECQARCDALNKKWISEGKKPFHIRIGINSGEIIVGNMGSAHRLNYTIIGDEVNLASRLEGLNKEYGTRIMLSKNTVDLLPDHFALRLLDFVTVKGKTRPVEVFELVAKKEDVTAIALEYMRSYNTAIQLYRKRDWTEASAAIALLLEERPDDKAAQIIMSRIREFQAHPPPERWRGEALAKAS